MLLNPNQDLSFSRSITGSVSKFFSPGIVSTFSAVMTKPGLTSFGSLPSAYAFFTNDGASKPRHADQAFESLIAFGWVMSSTQRLSSAFPEVSAKQFHS